MLSIINVGEKEGQVRFTALIDFRHKVGKVSGRAF